MVGTKRLASLAMWALAASVIALPQKASATLISGKVNADNEFWAYLSTSDTVAGTQIGYGSSWGTTESFSAELKPGVTHYLHLKVLDHSPPGGVIGAFSLGDSNFQFANGTDTLLTNIIDWKLSVTGFGSDYAAPAFQGLNGVPPWWTRPEIPADAAWLWTSQTGNPIYLSATINAVPEPASLSLLGLGALGLWRRRR